MGEIRKLKGKIKTTSCSKFSEMSWLVSSEYLGQFQSIILNKMKKIKVHSIYPINSILKDAKQILRLNNCF